jgi:hypothetical protein
MGVKIMSHVFLLIKSAVAKPELTRESHRGAGFIAAS